MPAIAKTSEEEIVRVARQIVDADGASSLSMQLVADEVGVRAPSLYKRFADRDALLDAVARQAIAELTARIAAVADDGPPARALVAMGRAYRAFAKKSPGVYALLFAPRKEAADLLDLRARAVRPLIEVLHLHAPAAPPLESARMLTAFLHGFVSMEIAGAFRLGGNITQAFAFGIETLVASLAEPKRAQHKKRGAEIASP
ncbi:MAG: TetR family transcriptional regulator [Polyangiaceae bacterium]|nr:TetR family transcriptional regulator [Polyangiaceae bacterium]